jgi:hypothetical protein
MSQSAKSRRVSRRRLYVALAMELSAAGPRDHGVSLNTVPQPSTQLPEAPPSFVVP